MLNRVTFIGRLTSDPKVRTVGNGQSVLNFTIATTQNYVGKDGEKITEFIDCTAWNKVAENMGKYLGQGDLIYIDGEMRTKDNEFEDKKFKTLYVQCNLFELIAKVKKQTEHKEPAQLESKKIDLNALELEIAEMLKSN